MRELLLKEMEIHEEFLKDTLSNHENKTIQKVLRIENLIGGWCTLNDLLSEIDKPKAVELLYHASNLLNMARKTQSEILKEFRSKTK